MIKVNIPEGKHQTAKCINFTKNKKPRSNWDKMFLKSDSKKDIEKLIPDVFNDKQIEDWTW